MKTYRGLLPRTKMAFYRAVKLSFENGDFLILRGVDFLEEAGLEERGTYLPNESLCYLTPQELPIEFLKAEGNKGGRLEDYLGPRIKRIDILPDDLHFESHQRMRLRKEDGKFFLDVEGEDAKEAEVQIYFQHGDITKDEVAGLLLLFQNGERLPVLKEEITSFHLVFAEKLDKCFRLVIAEKSYLSLKFGDKPRDGVRLYEEDGYSKEAAERRLLGDVDTRTPYLATNFSFIDLEDLVLYYQDGTCESFRLKPLYDWEDWDDEEDVESATCYPLSGGAIRLEFKDRFD